MAVTEVWDGGNVCGSLRTQLHGKCVEKGIIRCVSFILAPEDGNVASRPDNFV